MSEPTPIQPLPEQATTPDASEACATLRRSIKKLQHELAQREADTRPMPTSVMRAYQALMDKYFAQLAQLEDKSNPGPRA